MQKQFVGFAEHKKYGNKKWSLIMQLKCDHICENQPVSKKINYHVCAVVE